MTQITIIATVLTLIVLTSGQLKKMGGNMDSPWTRFVPRDIKQRIRVPPIPMPGLNVDAWLGPWTYQFRKSPCSWAISDQFTDHSQFLERQGKLIVTYDTSRNHNICNTIASVLTVSGPGRFAGKDLSGDNWSGETFVVATDYKQFSLTWGCTKWSTFDKICDDPWVYVKTRQLKVSNSVLRQVDSILLKVFGISINELSPIRHGKPCPRGRKKQG